VTRVNVQLLTAAILFVADLLLVIAAQVGAFLALTQRAGGEYLAQQKQEAIIEFALHSSKREIEFLTSAEGLTARAAARAMWKLVGCSRLAFCSAHLSSVL
jgi:hypothetical protein